jgi:predicted aspartyl protease
MPLRLRSLLFRLGIAAVAGLFTLPAHAAQCPIAQPHPLDREALAAVTGNLSLAETQYRQKVALQPKDAAAIAGLVGTLVAEEKLDEAESTAKTALAADPQSAALLTALAGVQHRQGLPWEEQKTLLEAQRVDVCYPRLHLALTDFYRFNSYFASAVREIKLAYQLDPYDLQIHGAWMQTLPLRDRIAELKKYLAANDADVQSVRRAQRELALLENRLENSKSACHLASTVTTTEIPFTPIMVDSTHIRGWGLEVAFNGRKSNLQVDTGAGGLYISRSVAQRAGLKSIASSETSGVGDKGAQSGYTAYADSIKIGGLEFKDCLVEVSDRKNVVDIDGLIGMDVFSNFLVTLDFPWHKLTLGPLPPYPDAAAAPATLNTEQESVADGPAAASAQETAPTAQPAAPPRGPHDRYIAPEMKNWESVYRVGHMMIVPTVLNGKTRRLFVIDTGAFRTSISPAAAREVTKVRSDDRDRVRGLSGNVANVYTGDKIIFRVAHLQEEMDNVLAFDNAGISKNLGTEVSGFLGFDLLHLLVVRIDYRDGLMDFEYSEDRGYQHIR